MRRRQTIRIKATIQAVDEHGNVLKPHRRRLRRVRCNAFILVTDEALALSLGEQIARDASSFAVLAQEHSQMPGEPDGTVLGGGFIPELEEAIRRLRANEVSPPIQTELGWFLIQRRRHRWTFE